MSWTAFLTSQNSYTPATPPGGGGGGSVTLPRYFTWMRGTFAPVMTPINVPIYAWEVFVDPDLGSDSNDGSSLTDLGGGVGPFQTRFKALQAFVAAGSPDDACIWLAGGKRYYEYINAAGTYGFSSADAGTTTNDASTLDGIGGRPGHELHIRTWWEHVQQGLVAIIDGSGIAMDFEAGGRTKYWYPNLWGLRAAHDIHFYEMEMVSSAGSPIWLISDNAGNPCRRLVIKNCHIHHSFGAPHFGEGTEDSFFEYNNSHHIMEDVTTSSGVQTQGTEGDAWKMPNALRCVARYNLLFAYADDGVDCKNSQANECYGNVCWRGGYDYTGAVNQQVGDDWWSHATDTTGYVDAPRGSGHGMKMGYDHKAHHNIFLDLKGFGCAWNGTNGHKVWHNTAINTSGVVALRDTAYALHNLEYPNPDSLLDNSGGAYPYARENSFADVSSGGRVTGNYNLTITPASDFQSIDPYDGDAFARPAVGGSITAVTGTTDLATINSWSGWAGWNETNLSATIGAREAT